MTCKGCERNNQMMEMDVDGAEPRLKRAAGPAVVCL